jgi:hypothetical protein
MERSSTTGERIHYEITRGSLGEGLPSGKKGDQYASVGVHDGAADGGGGGVAGVGNDDRLFARSRSRIQKPGLGDVKNKWAKVMGLNGPRKNPSVVLYVHRIGEAFSECRGSSCCGSGTETFRVPNVCFREAFRSGDDLGGNGRRAEG